MASSLKWGYLIDSPPRKRAFPSARSGVGASPNRSTSNTRRIPTSLHNPGVGFGLRFTQTTHVVNVFDFPDPQARHLNRPGFAGECLVRLVVDGGGWSGRWLVGGGVDMRKRGVVAVAATRGTVEFPPVAGHFHKERV